MTRNLEAMKNISLEAAQAVGLEAEDAVALQRHGEGRAWHVKRLLPGDRGVQVQVAINPGDSRDTIKEALRGELLLGSGGPRARRTLVPATTPGCVLPVR